MPPRDGYRDYPGAPDLRGDFSRSPGDEIDQERPEGTPDPVELLDDHDLSTWDYTPGGTIEQQVHTQLSEAGRAAYREATRGDHEFGQQYEQQLDEAFEQAAAKEDADYEQVEQMDEARRETIRLVDDEMRNRVVDQMLDEALERDLDDEPITGAELAKTFAERVREVNRSMTDADYGVAPIGEEPAHDGFHPMAEADLSPSELKEQIDKELAELGPTFDAAVERSGPEIDV